MRKLNKTEFEKLFEFTKAHYVEYYDLQIELVDHLACGIEEHWKTNETITFEDALQNEFKKFGIFGFSEIVESRRLELRKKYTKIFWRSVKEHLLTKGYFALMLLSSITYYLLGLISPKVTLCVLLISFYAFALYQFIRLNKSYKNKLKQQGKKLVLTEVIYKNFTSVGFFSSLLNLGIQSFLHLGVTFFYFNLFFAIVSPFGFLLLYVSCYYLPKHSEEILKELYPEYKLIIK